MPIELAYAIGITIVASAALIVLLTEFLRLPITIGVTWIPLDNSTKEPIVTGNTLALSCPFTVVLDTGGTVGAVVRVMTRNYIDVPENYAAIVSIDPAKFSVPDVSSFTQILPPGWNGELSLVIANHSQDPIDCKADTPFILVTLIAASNDKLCIKEPV